MNGYLVEQVMRNSRYKGTKRMILIVLAASMDTERVSFLGVKRIAQRAGVSVVNCRKHLAQMCWSDDQTQTMLAEGYTEADVTKRAARCELMRQHQASTQGDLTSNWYYLRRYPNEPVQGARANGNGKRRARRTS